MKFFWVQRWTGAPSNALPPSCPQATTGYGPTSADCLFLHLFAPASNIYFFYFFFNYYFLIFIIFFILGMLFPICFIFSHSFLFFLFSLLLLLLLLPPPGLMLTDIF